MNVNCNTQYLFKNCEAKLENFKPVITKALADRNRNKTEYERKQESAISKYVFKLIDKAKGEKITVQREVDREWKRKHKKNRTDPLNTHCVSKAARKKEVDMIMELAWGPLYKWIDKHKATIYRHLEDIYGLLPDLEKQSEQRQKEAKEKEKKDELAHHVWFQNYRRSGMDSGSGLGSTNKERYAVSAQLKEQLKGKSKPKPPEKITYGPTYRDIRETQRITEGKTEPEQLRSNMVTYEDALAVNNNYDENGFSIEDLIGKYGRSEARKRLYRYYSEHNDGKIPDKQKELWKIYTTEDLLEDRE